MATGLRLVKCASQPYCTNCDKPIPKWTTSAGGVWHQWVGDPPKSKEDCQRITNFKVMSVRYNKAERWDDDAGRYVPGPRAEWVVSSFTHWDGETYVDDLFCSGPCEVAFARAVATELKKRTA